jgi:hypothetical protein
MFTRNPLASLAAVVAIALVAAAAPFAQLPALRPDEPPVRVELKPSVASAGLLGTLGVVLEIQPEQPNIPAGLRGAIVVTNPGPEAVEFIDPRDSSQLELQTADGKLLRVPPVAPRSLINNADARPQAPVRLGPKGSHRIELVVTELLGERAPAAPSLPQASPNPPSNSAPLGAGKYRVRARTAIISGQGKPGDKRPHASFESGWVDVAFGPAPPK